MNELRRDRDMNKCINTEVYTYREIVSMQI